MPLIVLAVFAVLMCISCARPQRLYAYFQQSDLRLPFEQRLSVELNAPIIVLGTVADVAEVNKAQATKADARIKAQLTRIRLDIETVAKGHLSDPSI